MERVSLQALYKTAITNSEVLIIIKVAVYSRTKVSNFKIFVQNVSWALTFPVSIFPIFKL